MRVKWLGHACFLITSRSGLKIVTDPYVVGGGINYAPVGETADIVLVSHEHGDHNNVSAVQGKPEVVTGSGLRTIKGVQMKGIGVFHDGSQGQQRGLNTVFCFIVDDLRVCHLGDLGHVLATSEVGEIGGVDVLFLPVGGFFTIDAVAASQVCAQLKPRVTIPMHYKTPKCSYPIAGVEDFLKDKRNVRRLGGSEVEFEAGKLATAPEIVVLQPAR